MSRASWFQLFLTRVPVSRTLRNSVCACTLVCKTRVSAKLPQQAQRSSKSSLARMLRGVDKRG
eukprot:16427168-Heterocapsa_arctica.AAC.1